MKQGDEVRVLSTPTGYESQNANVTIGDTGIIQYVDGCCLCVKTSTAEFTANSNRFGLINYYRGKNNERD
jgi:hypothetical protein